MSYLVVAMCYRVLALFTLVIVLLSCAAKEKNLVVVPPSKNFPTQADSLQVIDKIHFKTNLYLWQNFMPKMSDAGPPFYLNLTIMVKNNSQKKIANFKIEKLTLYYNKSKKELNTFDLKGINDDSIVAEIAPQESKELNFTNDRSKVFSPKIKEGERFFARILVGWDEKKRIISSVPVAVEFTY